MKNFALGGLGLVAGGALWIAASIVGAFDNADDGNVSAVWWVPIIIGFLVMVCSPVAFWIVIPIVHRVRRKESR